MTAALPPLGHRAISASAGTGKTYTLTHRYIGLLLRQVPPERMVALTFSRKAAREIFDELVRHLADAVDDPKRARRSAAAAEAPGAGAADFLRALRLLVENLHRLHIGTIDSFVVGIVRAFPAELGVPASFTLENGAAGEAGRLALDALGAIFDPGRAPAGAQRAFLEAFRLATFGQQAKTLGRQFLDFCGDALATWHRVPDAARWGDPARLWPGGNAWLLPVPDLPARAEAAREALAAAGFPAKSVAPFERWIDFAAGYAPQSAWDDEAAAGSVAIERLWERAADLGRAVVEIPYGRAACTIDAAFGRALGALLRNLAWVELDRALRQSRGQAGVLAQYAQVYDAALRRTGRMTFADAQRLLTAANPVGGRRLSQRPEPDPRRLYIDYRLDCRLDHWMLDEFQDTNDLQWDALGNLASEIFQDAGGTRSFFLVGDAKQAIHAWRGGNARLLGEIAARYRVRQDTIAECRRSSAEVVATVNAVFDGLADPDLPAAAVARWNEPRNWRRHVASVDPPAPAPGYVALLDVPKLARGADGDPPALVAVAALVRQIDPARRRLRAAVLVDTNANCAAAADALRRLCPGVPVVNEGAHELAANPVVATLCALLRTAAHPGDTLAQGQLAMGPLRGALNRLAPPGTRPVRLLAELQRDGFEPFLRHWGAALGRSVPGGLDAYGAKRLDDLLGVAAAWDREGEGTVNGFLAAVENVTLREPADAGVVRVMTVHASKGLGFDVVFLPYLMGAAFGGGHDTQTPVVGGDAADPWVLVWPRQRIAALDGVLSAEDAKQAAENAYERLCVLYVALTRARHALYMITAFGPESKSVALSPARLLHRRLAGNRTDPSDRSDRTYDSRSAILSNARCLYEAGSPAWFEAFAPPGVAAPAAAAAPLPAAVPAAPPARRARLRRLEPSREDAVDRPAAWLFSRKAREVLDFGTAIHELLAQVEWVETADADAILAAWRPEGLSEAVQRDAREQFRRVVAAREVRAALARPPGGVTLWREKSFEMVVGNRWVSGTFDRVTLRLGADGRPRDAEILDYKSRRVESHAEIEAAAETYRPQLSLYREALVRLLGLPPGEVRLAILFTRTGKVHPLPPK